MQKDVEVLLDGQGDDVVLAVDVGWALLHEMPKELLDRGTPEERAEWVRERAAPARAASDARLDELLGVREKD